MNMKRTKIILLNILILFLLVLAACTVSSGQDNDTIIFWHSYQGYQQQIVDRMVTEYNNTIGKDNKITVEARYAGNTDEISYVFKKAYTSVEEQSKLPNIAIISKETAYTAVKYGLITFAETYMNQQELNKYFDGFLEEGRLSMRSNTYLFPVSKQIQQTIINRDLFHRFNSAYPMFSEASFASWEELMRMASAYYAWTDAMTPEIDNDGKAFFAIESLETFVYTYTNQHIPSLIQSGYDEITINANKDTFKDAWKIYYEGVVKGYMSTSTDMAHSLQNGNIVCYIGTPGKVKYSSVYIDLDDKTAPFTVLSAQYPSVHENRVVVPHSGPGAVVVDKDEETNQASYDFLKWFTTNPNFVYICFAGYEVPACSEIASSEKTLNEIAGLVTKNELQYNLLVCEYNQVLSFSTYSPAAFTGFDELGKNMSTYLLNESKSGKSMLDNYLLNGIAYDEAVNMVCSEASFERWFAGILDIVEGVNS